MFPLVIRKEIDAHIADRLLEAVWRESLWLVKDGVATTHEIDDAIRMGFGLRWAQMGLFETCRIAGGEAGMKHFMAQFGPCLSWPWTKLMDVPEFEDELVDLIAGQSDSQSGHMNETHYLEVGAQATDRVMELIGADAAYVAAGKSYFTVESHVRFLDEVKAGERIRVTTQVLGGEGKKMHLFHRVEREGTLVATVETMLLHMDLNARGSSLPAPEVAGKLAGLANAHAGLPPPDGAGRHVGRAQKRG